MSGTRRGAGDGDALGEYVLRSTHAVDLERLQFRDDEPGEDELPQRVRVDRDGLLGAGVGVDSEDRPFLPCIFDSSSSTSSSSSSFHSSSSSSSSTSLFFYTLLFPFIFLSFTFFFLGYDYNG